jgi:hypothetical protein
MSVIRIGVALIVIVGVAGAVLVASTVRADGWDETRSFPLPEEGETLWVEVEGNAARLTITGSDDLEAITLTTEVEGWDEDEVSIDTEYNDANLLIYIDVEMGVKDALDIPQQKLDLTLTVPVQLQLSVQLDVGEVVIENVEIVDELTIETSVASVNFDGVLGEGTHRIVSDVGQIDFTGTFTDGELEIGSNVGAVKFDGEFGPTGSMDVWTDVGSVIMLFSDQSAFQIEAKAELGRVNDKLDLANRTKDSSLVGTTITGTYGALEAPDAILTIEAQLGDIQLDDYSE